MTTEKDIYIVLTDTGTLFAKLIKCFTKTPLNHTSIAFNSNLDDVYSFGRKDVSNPFNGGFVQENMHETFYNDADCAIYRCRVSNHQYWHMYKQVSDMMENQQRYKYNYLGLFSLLINKKINQPDAYFCSQFVASVFEHINFPLVSKPAHLVTPGDFTKSPYLNEIYRGKLAGYLYENMPSSVMECSRPLHAMREMGTSVGHSYC